MKILLTKILIILLTLCTLLFGVLYLFQEKLLFFPEKLDKDFKFSFNQRFEEVNVKTQDDLFLNGLLFKSDSAKGLIFYLHGNAGSLNSWGEVAKTYTDLNYDVFMLDYRGYGKSDGEINSQEQLFQDTQRAYDKLKINYDQNKIIVLGYSIGTGLAAKISATNKPKLLILQAPYYSLTDMMQHYYPIIPPFMLKYKLETYKYIKDCNMPIVIFHGDKDEVIYYNSSVKLRELTKQSDRLVTLPGAGHNGMSNNPDYLNELNIILKN